jgi:hypothetical protein
MVSCDVARREVRFTCDGRDGARERVSAKENEEGSELHLR